MEVVIVTHTDLDGLTSAALLLRKLGRYDRLFFIQPHQLHRALNQVPNASEVYISDLGVNPANFDRVKAQVRRVIESGGSVEWFDHHVWDPHWIEDLIDVGVKLHIDTSTCGAGVVAKYLGLDDEVSRKLVSAACSVDLWRFDDPLGNFLARFSGLKGGKKWKEGVVRKLSKFSGIDSEILEAVEEAISRELKVVTSAIKKAGIKEVGGVRLAYYFKGDEEHLTSYVANALMSRFRADVAVICRKGSVSLRSYSLDVRSVAKALGGGGHPRASGARLNPPLLIRFLSLLGVKSLHLRWCVNKVINALKEVGVVR